MRRHKISMYPHKEEYSHGEELTMLSLLGFNCVEPYTTPFIINSSNQGILFIIKIIILSPFSKTTVLSSPTYLNSIRLNFPKTSQICYSTYKKKRPINPSKPIVKVNPICFQKRE